MDGTAGQIGCDRLPVSSPKHFLESTREQWEPRLFELIRRGRFVLGDEVACFEHEFARAMGGRYAVGVASGTDAVCLSLRAARLDGEVCTTALTAPYTALAIRAAGLRVRFVDVDEASLQMDSAHLESQLNKSTSGVVAVHLYGQPCAIEAIAEVTRRKRLTLVQDACQAHGATTESGVPLSHFGEYVAYSFYPTKNLGGLGDGGAVVTASAVVDRRLRLLRNGGRRDGQVSWVAGANSRLDEIQACFLRVFLGKLASTNAARRRIAGIYDQALAGCPGVRPVCRTTASVCHLYVIRAEGRSALRGWLQKAGIDTAVHYPMPLHLHPAFRDSGCVRGSLPRAEEACGQIVSLPLWVGMKDEDAYRVAERIQEFYS